jgi:sulfide dehydrogenase cytochrome subunit
MGDSMKHRLVLLAAWALSGLAQAQTPDALQVRSWAASCANCHGTQGNALPGMVALAGMPQAQIVQKMQDFKAGRLSATVMHQLAKGYSDEQITAIAAYFAAQKK